MFSELLSEKQHIKNNTHKHLCEWKPSSDPPSSNSALRRIIPYQTCNSLCGHCYREASK